MRILKAGSLALGILAFGAFAAPSAMAQGMAGAGGSGGSGAGVAGVSGVTVVSRASDVEFRNRSSDYASRVRSSTPPPMDPSRRVYEVDCTKPFDSLGKGNLRCM